jgi:hypothetical protein
MSKLKPREENAILRRILKEHHVNVIGIQHGQSRKGHYVNIQVAAPPGAFERSEEAHGNVYSKLGRRLQNEVRTLVAPHIDRELSDILVELVSETQDESGD